MLLLPAELRFSLNWGVVFATITAAAISIALSVLLLSKLRQQAIAGAVLRKTSKSLDNVTEDALIDEAGDSNSVNPTVAPASVQLPLANGSQNTDCCGGKS